MVAAAVSALSVGRGHGVVSRVCQAGPRFTGKQGAGAEGTLGDLGHLCPRCRTPVTGTVARVLRATGPARHLHSAGDSALCGDTTRSRHCRATPAPACVTSLLSQHSTLLIHQECPLSPQHPWQHHPGLAETVASPHQCLAAVATAAPTHPPVTVPPGPEWPCKARSAIQGSWSSRPSPPAQRASPPPSHPQKTPAGHARGERASTTPSSHTQPQSRVWAPWLPHQGDGWPQVLAAVGICHRARAAAGSGQRWK